MYRDLRTCILNPWAIWSILLTLFDFGYDYLEPRVGGWWASKGDANWETRKLRFLLHVFVVSEFLAAAPGRCQRCAGFSGYPFSSSSCQRLSRDDWDYYYMDQVPYPLFSETKCSKLEGLIDLKIKYNHRNTHKRRRSERVLLSFGETAWKISEWKR